MCELIKFIDLNNIINNLDNIYAHDNGADKEPLKNHLDSCGSIVKYIDKVYGVEDKIRSVFRNIKIEKRGKEFFLEENEIDFVIDMFFNAIYLHDIGKINPKFQLAKMKNENISDSYASSLIENAHSPLSAIIYMNEYLNRLKAEPFKEKLFLRLMMLSFANCIYSHHGSLNDMEDRFSEASVEEVLNTYATKNYLIYYKKELIVDKSIGNIFGKIKRQGLMFNTKATYIVSKILNSLIVSCDFISTHSYMKETPVASFRINNIDNYAEIQKAFQSTEIYKNMIEYKRDNSYFTKNKLPKINELRSSIALECRNNIKLHGKHHSIFNIEAPTGSGKTYNSLGCALQLLENKDFNKLLYISPVNAISNQVKKEFIKVFNGLVEIQEVNSITPLPEKKDSSGVVDYDKTLLERQILNYPITFTSHISFFDILFGRSRESSMPLFQLFNSVIILDEIQNYKNSIWKETIEMLNSYSEIMNIKVIIMSATLPNLQELVEEQNSNFINLLTTPANYYKNPIFKDRVNINTELLSKKVSLFDLKEAMVESIKERHLKHNDRGQIFLAEFIKKKTAVEFFEMIKANLSDSEYEIYELDSDNNSYTKEQIIERVKGYSGSKHLIIVTTQVIEAGIDIDADLGMKDAVFPDVDEQFIGRINRSSIKEDCSALFFNYDNEWDVYREDLRLGANIREEKYLKCLKDKEFGNILYRGVINKINICKNTSYISDLSRFLAEELLYFNYRKIEKRMQLISTSTISIYIPNGEVILKDGKNQSYILNGEEIWNQYAGLIADNVIKYSERRFKLSKLKEEMSFFTYTLYGKSIEGLESVGGVYYIHEGYAYIKEGKIDTPKFKEKYKIAY